MLSLVRILSKKNIWELLKTSFRWSEHRHQSAIRSQVDNAWLNASSFSSNLMMYWCISDRSGHTSLMMMTSTGILASPLLLLKNSKKLKKDFCKFKMRNISKTTVICLGYVGAISWTSSHTWHGRSTSTWKHQTSLWVSWTWSPTTATRWANSTTLSKLLMS